MSPSNTTPSADRPPRPPFPSDSYIANNLLGAKRHFFLINAANALDACQGAMALKRAPFDPISEKSLLVATRASSHLGFESSALSIDDYVELTRASRSRRPTLGLDVDGIGTYVVEVTLGSFRAIEGDDSPNFDSSALSVKQTDLILDVDGWGPNEELSEAHLRAAVTSMIERGALASDLPASISRKPASL